MVEDDEYALLSDDATQDLFRYPAIECYTIAPEV
jgi:hypothetical protein